jgi:hypothetical protein
MKLVVFLLLTDVFENLYIYVDIMVIGSLYYGNLPSERISDAKENRLT